MELLSIYAGCVACSAKKDKIDELLNLVEETNSPSDGGSLVLQGLTDMDFSVCCNEVFQNLFYEACKNWNSNDFQVLLEKVGPQIFSEFVKKIPRGAKEKEN